MSHSSIQFMINVNWSCTFGSRNESERNYPIASSTTLHIRYNRGLDFAKSAVQAFRCLFNMRNTQGGGLILPWGAQLIENFEYFPRENSLSGKCASVWTYFLSLKIQCLQRCPYQSYWVSQLNISFFDNWANLYNLPPQRANGEFEVTADCSDLISDSLFNKVGKKTKIILWVSAIGLESGLANTSGDAHSWGVKLNTYGGILD